MLDRRGELESLTASAERWIESLPGPQLGCGLPASVVAVASATRSGERRDGGSKALVRTVDGQWVRLHGTEICVDGQPRTAVTVELASPDRMAPC